MGKHDRRHSLKMQRSRGQKAKHERLKRQAAARGQQRMGAKAAPKKAPSRKPATVEAPPGVANEPGQP